MRQHSSKRGIPPGVSRIVIVLLVLTALACLPVTAAPARGGRLVVSLRSEPLYGLDPHKTSGIPASSVMRQIFDPLVYADQTGKLYPALATKWTVSPDGRVFTFELRRGVKFHDGTPFDANAVKFSLDRVADPATKSTQAVELLGAFYDRTEVVGPFTVRVVFKEPHPSFPLLLTNPYLAPVSPAAVRKFGDDFTRNPVGAGPFIFRSEVPKSEYVLDRNPDYRWGSPLFDNEGPAYLDGITFKVIQEDSVRMGTVEKGEVHISTFYPELDAPKLRDHPVLKGVIAAQPGVPIVLAFNTTNAPTDDLRVRQAIVYGINREEIVRRIAPGVFTPAYGPLSPSSMCYSKEVEKFYPYDPKRAAELLEAAGWRDTNNDGIRDKGGQPLQILLYVQTGGFPIDHTQIVQAQLKPLGVDIQLRVVTSAARVEAGQKGLHNMLSYGFVAEDPATLTLGFHSRRHGFPWNFTFYKSVQLDRTLEAAQTSIDEKRRCQLYGEIQKVIMERALIAPIYNLQAVFALRKEVQGFRYGPRANDPYLYGVWLERR